MKNPDSVTSTHHPEHHQVTPLNPNCPKDNTFPHRNSQDTTPELTQNLQVKKIALMGAKFCYHTSKKLPPYQQNPDFKDNRNALKDISNSLKDISNSLKDNLNCFKDNLNSFKDNFPPPPFAVMKSSREANKDVQP